MDIQTIINDDFQFNNIEIDKLPNKLFLYRLSKKWKVMIILDFYIQQIIVIFLVLNLKNYCYFKFRDTVLLSIDAIMDLIYTIVIYIVYGFGITILTLYNGIGIETIFYTFIFVFGIVKIFQIISIFKNKKINKKMMKITWIIEVIIFIIWLILSQSGNSRRKEYNEKNIVYITGILSYNNTNSDSRQNNKI